MTGTTREDIKTVFGILAAAYPGYNPQNPSQVIDAFYARLRDMPVKVLLLAAYNIPQKSKFFPNIFELREEAEQILFGNKFPQCKDGFDNACMEIMLRRGISDPGLLTEAEINQALSVEEVCNV